jgi:hypothetical protein
VFILFGFYRLALYRANRKRYKEKKWEYYYYCHYLLHCY